MPLYLTNFKFLFDRMVLFEQFQSLFENRELAARGQGDAGAETFAAVAAAGAQGDGAHAVV